MHRDDISQLYKYLGQSVHSYLDFQTEANFSKRINRIILRRSESMPAKGVAKRAASPARKSKIIAIISMGNLPGRKLTSSLAWMASNRFKGKVPVHVVDLVPSDNLQEEKSFLNKNGVKHILLNTSAQVVRMELAKEIDWLGRELIADNDDGLIIVDVPERVMHMRHQAMAIADMLLVMIPATAGAVRAIEDVELEIAEVLSPELKARVGYLLVKSEDAECIPPLLLSELVAHKDLFVPLCLQKESIPSAQDLSVGVNTDSVEYQCLEGVLNFILGKFGS